MVHEFPKILACENIEKPEINAFCWLMVISRLKNINILKFMETSQWIAAKLTIIPKIYLKYSWITVFNAFIVEARQKAKKATSINCLLSIILAKIKIKFCWNWKWRELLKLLKNITLKTKNNSLYAITTVDSVK